MAEPKLPQSVVDNFAQHNPSDEDVKSVMDALQSLGKNPDQGTPVPFNPERLRDCYLSWTQDKKWRILYRHKNPRGTEILSIEPEEG
jgi:hypothetical protein